MTGPGWVVAGRVGRPHGLDGSFHVTRPRAALLAAGRSVTVSGHPREIVRRAGTDERPIVRLDGCDDREAASALRAAELLVPVAEAPSLGEDEWWARDLEGCSVVDGELAVGVVRRLVGLPSCEALEVERPGATALLVPMVRDAVRDVDLAGRRIDVDLRFLGEREAGPEGDAGPERER